jgi:type I restriction enzyme S subunit
VVANLARARAGRLRQAILHRAFTGRLVAQDPDDEPAEELLERIRAGRGVVAAPGREGRETLPQRKRLIGVVTASGRGRGFPASTKTS